LTRFDVQVKALCDPEIRLKTPQNKTRTTREPD